MRHQYANCSKLSGLQKPFVILDLRFDRLSFQDVKDRLRAATAGTRYAYVVTPNVDHVVRVHREPELRPLYDEVAHLLTLSREDAA